MRTLKKSLALVLAVVMVLGLCVISASADFEDVDLEKNEAIAVLTGIGVIKGKSDTEFDPEGTLTREQAAAFIARLCGEGDLKANSSFEDVQGRWSEGNVAFCASQGIVNGVAEGRFDPTGTLTGMQWGKMLLVAIGFDPVAEGLANADTWQVAVVRLVRNKSLDNGVKGIDLTKPISREQACVMAFNAMQASVSGTKMYVADDGAEFDNVMEANAYRQMTGASITIKTASDTLQNNFPKLVENTKYADDFGRPGRQWKNDKTVLYTEINEANATFTYSGAAADIDLDAVNKGLKLTKDADKLKETVNTKYLYNGVEVAGEQLAAGDTVEVYYNNSKEISVVVVSHCDFAQVKEIKEHKADKDGNTKTITLAIAGKADKAFEDGNFAGFDYAKKDFILVAVSGNEVLASKAAETLTGKVESKKGTQYRINGKLMSIAADTIGVVALDNGTSGTWALDAAGNLAAVVEATEAAVYTTDYAFIYNIYKTVKTGAGSVDADGNPVAGKDSASYKAYIVTNEGEKRTLDVAVVEGTGANKGKVFIKGDADGAVFGDLNDLAEGANTYDYIVSAYTVVEGKFALATGEYGEAAYTTLSNTAKSSMVGGKYANNKTAFIFLGKTDKGIYNPTTKTGIKNAGITVATDVIYVADKNNNVIYVFVGTGEEVEKVSVPKAYALLLDAEPEVKTSGDDTLYTYSIMVEGAETEMVLTNETLYGIAKYDLFWYKTEDGVFSADVVLETGYVEHVNGSQLFVDGAEYDISNAKIFMISTTDGVKTMEKDGKLAAGQGVYVDANDKGVASVVYILSVPST